jgi:hypothetical protein
MAQLRYLLLARSPSFLAVRDLSAVLCPDPETCTRRFTQGHDSFDTYLFGDERQKHDLITQSASLSLEYGNPKRFSLFLNVPYLWIDETNKGLQDGSFYLKSLPAQAFRLPQSDHGCRAHVSLLQLPNRYRNAHRAKKYGLPCPRFDLQNKSDKGFFISLQSGLDFRSIPDALAF